jgi:hypothetical protein
VADRAYFYLAGLVALAFAGDLILNHGEASMFLVKKLFGMVDYLEFWR